MLMWALVNWEKRCANDHLSAETGSENSGEFHFEPILTQLQSTVFKPVLGSSQLRVPDISSRHARSSR